MVLQRITLVLITTFCISSCKQNQADKIVDVQKKVQDHTSLDKSKPPFFWDAANVYFLLTDRFKNGDLTNDVVLNRTKETGKLRGFEGGDLKGVIQKIEEGYFEKLGINALWFTPVVEQVHESVDEGTGNTYAYHGYWAKDWTAIDPNFGSMEDLKNLVTVAHKNGIRILLDVVLNHTGPVTAKDPVWPEAWVRTEPTCTYTNQETAVTCTLVKNLPDIRTESESAVELPQYLKDKWESEGRLAKEIRELDVFFKTSGLPRTPKNYIIKWLTDYIRELGIDGYRVDTVKHVEEEVWKTLAEQAQLAFTNWKENNKNQILDNNNFYLVGELYGYRIDNIQFFDFGDRKVNYFEHGFDNLINFQFKEDAAKLGYQELFEKYSTLLSDSLKNQSVTNYITSHDDGNPYDLKRNKTFEGGTKLLLSPGVSQVYYGDETARHLSIEGTEGDATLRSNMNWDDLAENEEPKKLLNHWQKLGQFRKQHPAIGAGIHKTITQNPFVFSRIFNKNDFIDKVVVGLEMEKGKKIININNLFEEETKVIDQYSGTTSIVQNNLVEINTDFSIVLLEAIEQ